MTVATDWSLIVLTGGSGTRLGGADKAQLRVGDRSLLAALLDEVPAGVPIVVAGPELAVSRDVRFSPENPAGGGPVAGIAAAVDGVQTELVLVAAVDMPRANALLPELLVRLRATDGDAVIPVSSDGRPQVLLSGWRTSRLRAALGRLGDVRDRSVRELVACARTTPWLLSDEESSSTADIDTPADLERARTHDGDRTL